jgi:flagellar protein FliL
MALALQAVGETTMADAPAAAPVADAPPKKGGMPTILLALNALLLVGVLGAVVALILKKPSGAPAATTEAAAPEHGGHEEKKEGEKSEAGHEGGHGAGTPTIGGVGPTLRLADFVVHLRNPESDRYARFSLEVEVGNDHDKEVLTARQAQVRDAYISYLSDRTVEDLRGSVGLEKLKQALLDKVSDLAKDAHPRNVYITDFLLQ